MNEAANAAPALELDSDLQVASGSPARVFLFFLWSNIDAEYGGDQCLTQWSPALLFSAVTEGRHVVGAPAALVAAIREHARRKGEPRLSRTPWLAPPLRPGGNEAFRWRPS